MVDSWATQNNVDGVALFPVYRFFNGIYSAATVL